MNWEASYNVIAPPKSNVLELVGWVTLDNQSGKTFRDARLKLMAGDVNKVPPPGSIPMGSAGAITFAGRGGGQFGPPVTEKTFDEYHLYTLEHPTHSPRSRNQTGGNGPRRRDPVQGRLRLRRI